MKSNSWIGEFDPKLCRFYGIEVNFLWCHLRYIIPIYRWVSSNMFEIKFQSDR